MSTWESSSSPDFGVAQAQVVPAPVDAAAATAKAGHAAAATAEPGDAAAATAEPGDAAGATAAGADAPGATAAGADAPGAAGSDPGGDTLAQLGEIPLADHPAVFERIHADLQAALAGIDSA